MSDDSSNTNTNTNGEGSDEAKPKMVPLAELAAQRAKYQELKLKVEAFEKEKAEAENAKLSEIERFKKENEELTKTISNFQEMDAKNKAFLKAKAAIGDQYELPADAEIKLTSKIAKLQFSDEIETDVLDLVELAKRPKQSTKSALTNHNSTDGNGKSGSGKKPKDYTTDELARLRYSDKEEYDRVMAARR